MSEISHGKKNCWTDITSSRDASASNKNNNKNNNKNKKYNNNGQNISLFVRYQVNQIQNISRLQSLWNVPPKPQYLMITSFMRYYTRATMVKISHCSWDTTPDPQYPRLAEFMRCFTKTTISHGCRFFEI